MLYSYQLVKKKRSIINDINMDDFIGRNNSALLPISKTSDFVEYEVRELKTEYLLNVI